MDLIDNEIFDIKFFNGQIYLLKKSIITSSQIESSIKSIKYSGEKLQKDTVVENSKLPPFIAAFYKYIFENNAIPTERDLISYYLDNYYDLKDENTCSVKKTLSMYAQNQLLSITGIKARLLRSYPSLIRDFHFYQLCTESKLFDKVVYSLNVDYYDGYDLIIEYGGKKFAVALFIETVRGNLYKSKKLYRHNPVNSYEEVNLSINKSDCQLVGAFYLYKKDHVIKLLEELKKKCV